MSCNTDYSSIATSTAGGTALTATSMGTTSDSFSIKDDTGVNVVRDVTIDMLPNILEGLYRGYELDDLTAIPKDKLVPSQGDVNQGKMTFETLLKQLPSFPGWNTPAMKEMLNSIWKGLYEELYFAQHDGTTVFPETVDQCKAVLATLRLAYAGQESVALRRYWELVEGKLGLS